MKLTWFGLPDRNCFLRDLAAACDEASASAPLSLILMDLDNFCKLNYDHSPVAGDEVLKEIGPVMRDAVGGRGKAYHHGSDEFAVLLPDCAVAEAREIAERIRSDVEAVECSVPGLDAKLKTTLSAGVTSFPESAADVEALRRAADDALCSAKGAGKNRVHTSPSQ